MKAGVTWYVRFLICLVFWRSEEDIVKNYHTNVSFYAIIDE